MKNYIESSLVGECISIMMPELASVIHARHGTLPSIREGTFSDLALALLKIACTKPPSILTGDMARLCAKAKDFWRAVFVIGTLFSHDHVTSWLDIHPSFTLDCLAFLNECVTLLLSFVNSDVQSTGHTAASFFTDLVADLVMQPIQDMSVGPDFRSVAMGAVAAEGPDFRSVAMSVDITLPTDGLAVNIPTLTQAQTQTQAPTSQSCANLIRVIKEHMVSLRNIMRRFPHGHDEREKARKGIKNLCGLLLVLHNRVLNRQNAEIMMWEVFGHPGDM